MLIFGPLKSRDWQKNNVAVNNSGQLVSQGEAPGVLDATQLFFVTLWMVISQLSAGSKRLRLNVSLLAFPRTTGWKRASESCVICVFFSLSVPRFLISSVTTHPWANTKHQLRKHSAFSRSHYLDALLWTLKHFITGTFTLSCLSLGIVWILVCVWMVIGPFKAN